MIELPDVVRRYQDAHDRHETEAALGRFTPDAIVTDDGQTYRGQVEIRDWLSRASAKFTYTRTLMDVATVGDDTWLVTNRLEGDFPGGVVDLRYRFVISEGRIAELYIAP
jgi:hypothetical protein